MRSRKPGIFVLADDLTGAAEIGGMAFQCGLSARIISASCGKFRYPEEVVILETGSRGMTAGQAYAVVERLIADCDFAGYDMVFKKVDSVLRGPVVSETEALSARLGCSSILLVPANPSRQRCIEGGRYFIENRPLEESEFRLDPEYPRITSWVADLLGDAGSEILTGPDGSRFEKGKISVPDVRSEMDIRNIVAGLPVSGVLPSGGSDFFRILLTDRLRLKDMVKPVPLEKNEIHCFISASRSENSRLAISKLRKNGYLIFDLPGMAIFDESVFREWTGKILEALAKGIKFVVRGPENPETDPLSIEGITGRIAGAAELIAGHVPPGAQMFIEGGETGSQVARRMGWDHLRVTKVHDTGVVTLQPAGWAIDLILKPGSYPWPENLLK